MKRLLGLATVLCVVLFAHTAMAADSSLVVANAAGYDSGSSQVLQYLYKTPSLRMSQSNVADGGSCSVSCGGGSASKTCANQGENCTCSCNSNDDPYCSPCKKSK